MKLKTLWAFMAIFFIAGAGCIALLLWQNPTAEHDASAYNDIARSLGEDWGALNSAPLPGLQYHLAYAVIDLKGALVAETKPGLDASIPAAVRHGDLMLDVISKGTVVGNVIFDNSDRQLLRAQRQLLVFLGGALLMIPLLFCAFFGVMLRKRLVEPFKKLDIFARRVAQGNLEVPLLMDRQNIFGPFTESFDLMRTELRRARASEQQASQSKKELVAALSHDIKTPVASIQARTELMLAMEPDEKQRRNLESIVQKTRQITALVTNLFQSSLEELQTLKVVPVAASSDSLAPLIKNADYLEQADIPVALPCLIFMDSLRLAQVFDNVFSNAYKYAGTAMAVSYTFSGDFLVVTVSDHGPGAPESSLPLLCNKFYRGENAAGISGSGLGLYLARFFMEQMGGGITYENYIEDGAARGFRVHVALPLVGRQGDLRNS